MLFIIGPIIPFGPTDVLASLLITVIVGRLQGRHAKLIRKPPKRQARVSLAEPRPEQAGRGETMSAPADDTNIPVVMPAPTANGRKQAGCHRALRRALKRAADYAMRHDDPAAAANEALLMLRAELEWRFELTRSRQRRPALIAPEPLPPATTVSPLTRPPHRHLPDPADGTKNP
jgi:hypothetical protein